MDLKDKIVGLFLIGIVTLLTWNLHQTCSMKTEIMKLQQGQEVLSKQIKKNTNFVKQKLKQLKKKQNKKVIKNEINKNNKKKKKKKKKVENE